MRIEIKKSIPLRQGSFSPYFLASIYGVGGFSNRTK